MLDSLHTKGRYRACNWGIHTVDTHGHTARQTDGEATHTHTHKHTQNCLITRAYIKMQEPCWKACMQKEKEYKIDNHYNCKSTKNRSRVAFGRQHVMQTMPMSCHLVSRVSIAFFCLHQQLFVRKWYIKFCPGVDHCWRVWTCTLSC